MSDEKERRNQEEKKILDEELEKYNNLNRFTRKGKKESKKKKERWKDEDKKVSEEKKQKKSKSKEEEEDEDESKSEEEEEEDEEKEEEKIEMQLEFNKINKKCSLNEHKENDANVFCQECNIYMCNKCEKLHQGLFKNHHQFKLDNNISEIFTGLCIKKKHLNKLEYLCKTHNQLCYAACIAKIKAKGYGQHKYCQVCFIQKAKNKKMKNLKKNMDFLGDLSNNIENSIKQLKILFEKINSNKEELKIKVQKIFTNLRNALNNREDKLLFEIDKQYNDLFFDESLIKISEKIPEKIKVSLEKGKLIGEQWNDENKLCFLINDCINIENNIKDINMIISSIEKCNENKNIKVKFLPEENEINNFITFINSFGIISNNKNKYKFKKSPLNFNMSKEYDIIGINDNILIKTDPTSLKTYICEYELEKGIENKWKIKILNSKSNHIMVGVTTIDCDLKSLSYNNCGWYISLFTSNLYSGPPHYYDGKESDLKIVEDEITIIMNMNNGTLKFIIDDEDKGESYTNIPLDKPLIPAVILYDSNDKVEITEC